MTPEDSDRIKSAEALKNDGQVKKGGFAARAERAADANVKAGYVPPRDSESK